MIYSRLKFLSKTIFFSIATIFCSNILGQDNAVALGEWRSHLSYESMVGITESEDAVFYASVQAVLKVNKEDLSLEHLNKVIGLSDMRVATLEYNETEKLLVIAYVNGNIDLLYDNGQITNLSAILVNNNVVGVKSINHIFNAGKKIYFSCSFGLVIYDLDLDAFSQTTFTSSEVNACSQLNDTLFISTSQGIYAGVLDGRNLLDFGQWDLQTTEHGLNIGPYSSKNLINFNNKIYADAKDTLFQYYNGQWQHITGVDKLLNLPITFWSPTGSADFIVNYNFSLNYSKDQLIIATNTAKYYTINAANDVSTNFYTGAWRINDIVIDQDNIHWASDEGYIHRNFSYVKPNSPLKNQVSDMHVDEEGTLWVTSSPYNTYGNFWSTTGFFRYKEGIWTMFNKSITSKMDTFWDCIRVTSNPENNKVYVSSFMSGLLEMDANENIVIYDQYNAPNNALNGANGDESRTRVMGLAVDDDGNVWMANSRSHNSLLVVKKLNGDWKSFPSSEFNDFQVEDLVIDRNGYKWIKQVTGKITVFDSGDLDDDTDNRTIQLGDNNTVLPNNVIICMESDKKGVVWVGTNAGIAIFNCSSNIFDGACQGNRPIISQDNFNGYLLEGEEVLAIETDGANRKWVGTKNGLFLLSADGYDQLAYFTVDNSPLFDNEVTKLAFDGLTGTLYMATSSGIQSYRTESTTGVKKMSDCCDQEGVHISPHPVEHDYTGPIAISYLADEANVKITDISGRLIYETTALGGQAIWDGKDYNGRKAQSGVYLVFIVNEQGSRKAVCKILFNN